MCRYGFIALALVSLCSSGLALGEDPSAKNDEGFVSLFDGKSLKGWEVMNGGKFGVENGVIKLNGGSGWLRSAEEYDDFILRLQVRWLKPKQDSGIFLRASKEGDNWPKRRYEVQCENSERVAMLFGAKHERNKDLAVKSLKPTGEWNLYEIKCQGRRLEVKLNDQLVTTSDSLSEPKGYLGIQGEGGLLEFRNLRIKRVKKLAADAIDRRLQEIQPTAKEKRFEEIGWASGLLEARRLAKESGRPVFLFSNVGQLDIGRC